MALLLVAALSTGGCGGTETVTVTEAVPTSSTNPFSPTEEITSFGHIESLAVGDDGYELRFDPAWFLMGETANAAAAEDGAVEPGEPVPNDNYVVDEGHRLLAYRLQEDAEVTVLTRRGDPAQIGATEITVDELAKIVDGASDLELFEPLDSGIWVTARGDRVVAIRQQYRP